MSDDKKELKPSYIKIRNKILPVCKHANCKIYKVWDFDTCWNHLSATEKEKLIDNLHEHIRLKKDMTNMILSKVNLVNFDFSNMNLTGSFFAGANLKNSKFIDSDLTRVYLGAANLSNSDLTRAKMKGTVLTGTNLKNARLLAFSVRYKPINILQENFGEEGFFKKSHINENEPYFARATYQSLKSYFSNRGDYDGASWASYRERYMQSKDLWSRKNYSKWIISKAFDLICGYGEKPVRPFIASIFCISFYAIIYKVFNFVAYVDEENKFGWIDSLYFSFSTFCGYSFPDTIPKIDAFARLVISSEAFLGIFALGLFIFTLSKRFVAR